MTSETAERAKLRLLRMHFESGVGHIGGNLSAIDALLVLFHDVLGDGDQFVLSKGHAAGALYTAMWSKGVLSDADLQTFHRDDTVLAGHPPARGIPAITFASGSLGHGLSLAAGFALGCRLSGNTSHAYCLTSDGEWQEGSTWEALIFACHQRLSNLTILVDHNGIQGTGNTADIASMNPLWERLAGFDLDVDLVDGHDYEALAAALAPRASAARPRCVILQTVKGHGVSFMEHRFEWHYLPMTREQYECAIREVTAS